MKEAVVKNFAIGESFSFQKSFADYPAAQGWMLTYYFRGNGKGFDVAGEALNDDFIVKVLPSHTNDCTTGKYKFQAFVSDGGNQILVDEGEVRITPNFSRIDASENFDGRTENEIALDAIRATIAKKATADQQEYTIGTRSLRRIPMTELIQLEQLYTQRVTRERTAERLRKGGKFFKTVLVRQRD